MNTSVSLALLEPLPCMPSAASPPQSEIISTLSRETKKLTIAGPPPGNGMAAPPAKWVA